MIITCKRSIPFSWILIAILPWAAFSFYGNVMSAAAVFSFRHFVENPAVITFILSLPVAITMIGQPIVGFISDRCWTKFGRRKPFIVCGQIGIMFFLVLMPLMPNFWSLLAVFIAYNLCVDFNAALEPLKQEIVPVHERGRAAGIMQWCTTLSFVVFYAVALGRFDDVTFMAVSSGWRASHLLVGGSPAWLDVDAHRFGYQGGRSQKPASRAKDFGAHIF